MEKTQGRRSQMRFGWTYNDSRQTRPKVEDAVCAMGFMNPRPISAFFLASAILCSMMFVFAANAPPDPLWQKALAVARANTDWVPGLVVLRSEVSSKGETQGVHELWKRSSLGSAGEVVTQTVKILEDGKDVTEQEKKKEKKSKTKDSGVHAAGNPFDSETQNRLSLKPTQQFRVIAGKECVGYSFEVRNANGPTVRGLAWLAKETGIPTEIENMALDPLPEKHLKALAITTRYESADDGAWRVKEIRTTGRISIFFIQADFRSTMTFSEYWKKPKQKMSSGTAEK